MSTLTTSAHKITAKVSIPAPVAQIYYLVSTRSGWLDWFANKGYGKVGPQGVLQMYHPKLGSHLAFVFQELVQDEHVRFNTLDTETLETSEVQIDLAADGGLTILTVTQTGLDDEEAARWQTIWQESIDSLKEIIETGKDPRMWNRPFLGVTVEDWLSPESAAERSLAIESGMLLNNVFEGKGAEQAGIQGGDVILWLAGIEIVDYESLLKVYKDHKAGATIPVVYWHKGEQFESELTLSSFPVPDVPQPPRTWLII